MHHRVTRGAQSRPGSPSWPGRPGACAERGDSRVPVGPRPDPQLPRHLTRRSGVVHRTKNADLRTRLTRLGSGRKTERVRKKSVSREPATPDTAGRPRLAHLRRRFMNGPGSVSRYCPADSPGLCVPHQRARIYGRLAPQVRRAQGLSPKRGGWAPHAESKRRSPPNERLESTRGLELAPELGPIRALAAHAVGLVPSNLYGEGGMQVLTEPQTELIERLVRLAGSAQELLRALESARAQYGGALTLDQLVATINHLRVNREES